MGHIICKPATVHAQHSKKCRQAGRLPMKGFTISVLCSVFWNTDPLLHSAQRCKWKELIWQEVIHNAQANQKSALEKKPGLFRKLILFTVAHFPAFLSLWGLLSLCFFVAYLMLEVQILLLSITKSTVATWGNTGRAFSITEDAASFLGHFVFQLQQLFSTTHTGPLFHF